MGHPRVSCGQTDFNRDFGAFTEEDRRNGTGWNFSTPAGTGIDLRGEELMGLSAFELEDGVVYHTYTDALITTWGSSTARREVARTTAFSIYRAATTSTGRSHDPRVKVS